MTDYRYLILTFLQKRVPVPIQTRFDHNAVENCTTVFGFMYFFQKTTLSKDCCKENPKKIVLCYCVCVQQFMISSHDQNRFRSNLDLESLDSELQLQGQRRTALETITMLYIIWYDMKAAKPCLHSFAMKRTHAGEYCLALFWYRRIRGNHLRVLVERFRTMIWLYVLMDLPWF